MPLYQYECTSCGRISEAQVTISERLKLTEEPCTQCEQNCVQLKICAPAIGDSVRLGIRKPPVEFQEVLKNVKKNHPKGHINI